MDPFLSTVLSFLLPLPSETALKNWECLNWCLNWQLFVKREGLGCGCVGGVSVDSSKAEIRRTCDQIWPANRKGERWKISVSFCSTKQLLLIQTVDWALQEKKAERGNYWTTHTGSIRWHKNLYPRISGLRAHHVTQLTTPATHQYHEQKRHETTACTECLKH